jgi:hypothetical protein
VASVNALNLVPVTGRDSYAIAQNGSGTSGAQDEIRTTAVDAVRYADAQSRIVQASNQTDADWTDTETVDAESWSEVVSSRPQQTLPFMAQLLAQQDSSEQAAGLPPSVRFTAQQAYISSRDSTVQYLSPSPLYDFFV